MLAPHTSDMFFHDFSAHRRHCQLIADDLDSIPKRPESQTFQEYMLPNDRGALLGYCNTRLPLQRHHCAEVLWRFFGDMGAMNANGEQLEELSKINIHRLVQRKHSLFFSLSGAVKDAYRRPSFRRCEIAADLYCRFLYVHCKWQGNFFFNILWELYHFLKCYPSPTITAFNEQDWLQELRKKKASKWIESMDKQFMRARIQQDMGDDHFQNGELFEAACFYLRALFEICPWLPSQWYLSHEDAKHLVENGYDLIGHCGNRLAYVAWKEGRDDLAKDVANLTATCGFASKGAALQAHSITLLARQSANDETEDRTATWDTVVQPILPGVPEFWFAGTFSGATFRLFDVVLWAKTLHKCGNRSKFWNFDYQTTGLISKNAQLAWRQIYGEDREPFHWDGTEDEALGKELGSEVEDDIYSYLTENV